MYHAVFDLGAAAVDGVVQRVPGVVAMRFRGESGVTEGRDQMCVQFPHRVRGDQYAFLFRIMRNPEGFGEAGVPG